MKANIARDNSLLLNFNAETSTIILGKKDMDNGTVAPVNIFTDEEAIALMKTLLGKDEKPGAMTAIINWDYSRGKDKTILLIGQKDPITPELKVLNVLKGGDVFDLIKKLLGKDNL